MIDIEIEKLLTARQACSVFPTPVSLPTIWRWMLKGVRGVVLESVKIGGRRFTSLDACLRFASTNANPSLKTPPQNRQVEVQQARAILDQFGV